MFPMKHHDVQNDMESFVILVLYYDPRYMKTNAFDLKRLMYRVFDDGDLGPDGRSRGGHGKKAMFLRRQHTDIRQRT